MCIRPCCYGITPPQNGEVILSVHLLRCHYLLLFFRKLNRHWPWSLAFASAVTWAQSADASAFDGVARAGVQSQPPQLVRSNCTDPWGRTVPGGVATFAGTCPSRMGGGSPNGRPKPFFSRFICSLAAWRDSQWCVRWPEPALPRTVHCYFFADARRGLGQRLYSANCCCHHSKPVLTFSRRCMARR